MKKVLSTLLATIMIISCFASIPMTTQAANDYSAFPIYEEMPEDNLKTAPEIKLNSSYNLNFRRGTYTDSNKTNLYSVSDWDKALKFVPTATGYYETSIYVAERNQHMSVKFAYSDAESLNENKYYTVSKGDYEYNVHTSKEESIADSKYNVYRNTARGAAYLEKGKTYYIIAYENYDDYNVEKLMKTEVQGYTYHTVPATVKVYKHSHDYEVDTYKYDNYTYAYYDCVVCGYSYSSSFYKPQTMTLSTTSYTYDGKVKTPSVTIKDSNGKTISKSYYDVIYSSGRKNVGQYTVKVKFKKEYARFGSMSKTFTIKPKGTSISKVTATKKGFKVYWKKQSSQTSGYQIQYATNSKFSKAKTVTVNKNSYTSKSISKLSAKKKYYVRVRTYKTVKINGKNTNIYSGWSKAKVVTTKK